VIPLKDNIPTLRFPVVTVVLIALNVAVFAWQLGFSGDGGTADSPALAKQGVSERDQVSIEYGAIPREITHPGTYCVPAARPGGEAKCGSRESFKEEDVEQAPWWTTLFSSMFMHGDILHIAFNMLFLWIFGNNIEDSMGRLRFVLFYLLGGIAADYAQAAIDPGATVPTIGASGAIAAVLGGYALLYPRARVLTVVFIVLFVTLIEIPALVMLGIWFVLQFLPAIGQVAVTEPGGQGGGVAYFAHVGGFLFGLAMIKLFATRAKRPMPPPTSPVY
jgi:rhomboid family protein